MEAAEILREAAQHELVVTDDQPDQSRLWDLVEPMIDVMRPFGLDITERADRGVGVEL
jgi:hypothetical protein